jgi:hypothetical protein
MGVAFKNRLLLLVGLLFFAMTACRREKSHFETVLTDKRNCWIYYNHPDVPPKERSVILACTRFYEDGTFQAMEMTGKNNKPAQSYNIDGDYGPNEWSYRNSDSTLLLGSNEFNQFHVVSCSTDTIVMKNHGGEIHKLVRN